jgi:hypothetical protein
VGSDSGEAPFDICLSGKNCPIMLVRPLIEINREKRRQNILSKDVAPVQYLRPGMVLLKRFLKHDDQVRLCIQMLLLFAISVQPLNAFLHLTFLLYVVNYLSASIFFHSALP